MYDKTGIFNLALSALFLQKKISDSETDPSKEATILRSHWDAAWNIGLQELDTDSVAVTAALELLAEAPDSNWDYVYKYPDNCAFLRRIVPTLGGEVTDDTLTVIDRKISRYLTNKAIFTNEIDAKAEYIPNDLSPDDLNAEEALFIAYKLARLCLPLIIGKDSDNVAKLLEARYQQAHLDARAKSAKETNIYQEDWQRSEFVKHRLS
jgi:hypothetical protein